MSEPTEKQIPPAPDWLEIESLDLEAQGVAHKSDGKVVFVEGALPFERVSASTYRKKNNWEQANLTVIHRESSQRVRPGCPHFGLHSSVCLRWLQDAALARGRPGGGEATRVLEDNLCDRASLPEMLLRPIEGPTWGYRYRARLSVRYVIKKGLCWWFPRAQEPLCGRLWKSARCCRPTSVLCSCRCAHSSPRSMRATPAHKLELACGDSASA